MPACDSTVGSSYANRRYAEGWTLLVMRQCAESCKQGSNLNYKTIGPLCCNMNVSRALPTVALDCTVTACLVAAYPVGR